MITIACQVRGHKKLHMYEENKFKIEKGVRGWVGSISVVMSASSKVQLFPAAYTTLDFILCCPFEYCYIYHTEQSTTVAIYVPILHKSWVATGIVLIGRPSCMAIESGHACTESDHGRGIFHGRK